MPEVATQAKRPMGKATRDAFGRALEAFGADHPEVVNRLLGYAEKARADMGDALTGRKGTGTREPGRLPAEKK